MQIACGWGTRCQLRQFRPCRHSVLTVSGVAEGRATLHPAHHDVVEGAARIEAATTGGDSDKIS